MKTIFPFLFLLATALSLTAAGPVPSPAPTPGTVAASERFLELFQPFRSTNAALSPDGRHLAYSVREQEKTSIVIVEVSQPGKIKTRVNIGTDNDATPMLTNNDEPTPLAISWMHWVTPTRLAVMTNHTCAFQQYQNDFNPSHASRSFDNMIDRNPRLSSLSGTNFSPDDLTQGWSSMAGAIIAMNADGKNVKVVLTATDLSREIGPEHIPSRTKTIRQMQMVRPRVFDFSPTDPEAIIIQADTRERSFFCKLNVLTGKVKVLNEEVLETSFTPMFDRQGKLRGGITGTRFSSPPFNFVLQKEGLSLGRWKNLDEITNPSGHGGFSITPDNIFGERSQPLGFDENPDLLYYASNINRDTFGIYSLSLKTGARTSFAVEIPGVDLLPAPSKEIHSSVLIFDRFNRSLTGIRYESTLRSTRWLKPELATVQQNLEANFPGKNIEILEWDHPANHFLFLVHGVADPGSFMLYNPSKKTIHDIVRRATWIETRLQHRIMNFSIDAPDGQKITGLLTFPAAGRFATVPVVVRCPTHPSERVPLNFQAESMAIADMGFAVLQVNSRSAWGFGIRQRESIKNGYERILIADILTALEKLSKRYRINPQRVALVGEGYGGFVALRGLQLEPDRFRCAASIEAPLDLAAWMEYDRWTRRSTTLELTRAYYGDENAFKNPVLIRNPEKITKPVCLLAFPGRDGAPRTHSYLETRRFASALRRQGTPVDFNELEKNNDTDIDNIETASNPKSTFTDLDPEFAQRLPRAEAAVYRKIEYFLNAYIYDYQVKLGPLKELPNVGN